jgi:cell division protein FtsB
VATQHRQDATAGLIPHGNMAVALLVAAMIVGFAAMLPLVQSSGSTATSGQIGALQQERADWSARLQEQEIRVAELGSLDHIEEEARNRLGMVEPTSIRYIRVPAAAPAPHHIPSRYLPQPTPESHAGSSLWDDILDRLPVP